MAAYSPMIEVTLDDSVESINPSRDEVDSSEGRVQPLGPSPAFDRVEECPYGLDDLELVVLP